MIDYNSQMEARLSRMNELFSRAEAFQFEMNKLKEAYGLTQSETFHELPIETQQETTNTVRESYENIQTPMQETKNVYDDINIDDILASMDLDLQL